MIINLTQHQASAEQHAAGVVDPTPEEKTEIVGLLTFDLLPESGEVACRALRLATLAAGLTWGPLPDGGEGVREGTRIMIGGAPYLMAPLEKELRSWGLIPVYAFSVRESVETTDPDGTVRKSTVFRHRGFVEA